MLPPMIPYPKKFLIHCITGFIVFSQSVFASDHSLKADSVVEILEKSANWHLENKITNIAIRDWHMSPYYNGLIALSQATGNPEYLAHVIDYGERAGWALGDLPYYANSHAVGHAWLDIYVMDPSQEYRLSPTRNRMDTIVANPITEHLSYETHKYYTASGRWIWCDALFMSPPTLARLSKITGDEKYLRFMDYEFRYWYDRLWDAEEKLFYRDTRFLDKRTENGKKILWSRGNGWVYAGLALVLDVLPENDVARPFYEQMFLEMTSAIVKTQQEDGLWRQNLADPEQVVVGESSGSAFFIYGILWGINHGLLDKETHWSVVEKGWESLVNCIQPNGMLGFVQPVGHDPRDEVTADDTQVYGAGALLMAGAELLKALNHKPALSHEELLAQATELRTDWSHSRKVNAYVVPTRADDVAWENDKVAFRVYGPALKSKTENNGIDLWTKRVDYPIVEKWYRESREGKSYHKDHGEGYDAYKVGANRGGGSTGILYNGKLYTPNVYWMARIRDTYGDEIRMQFEYRYDIEGQQVDERKRISLKEGCYLCEARSYFWGPKEITDNMQVVIGLTPQGEEYSANFDNGVLTLWDRMDDYTLASAVKVNSGYVPGSISQVENLSNQKDALIALKIEKDHVNYQFGFAWERHSDFEAIEDWIQYVQLSQADVFHENN